MKIAIVSMQRIVNNGSYLQAYALRETLSKLSGASVGFLDFENGIHIKEEAKQKEQRLLNAMRDIKHTLLPKYRPYMKTVRYKKKFRYQWQQRLGELGLTDEMQYPGDTEYDLAVVGSDEMFNVCQYYNEGAEIPWTVLGEGIKTRRLVSYAVSCGQTTADTLNEIGEKEHFCMLLNRFDAVSVRDENTYNVVKELSTAEPQYNIDPVLLLPTFPKDKTYKKLPYKYVLIYAYNRRISDKKEIDAIKSYAEKRGLKTICVNCYQTWCDRYFAVSPFALLQYIKDAECVVTDTFHGTVFSIRNNVPFVAMVRESNRNKLEFLLKQFGLKSRQITDAGNLESQMDAPIDFEAVNKKLELERRKAVDYLQNQIDLAEGSINE